MKNMKKIFMSFILFMPFMFDLLGQRQQAPREDLEDRENVLDLHNPDTRRRRRIITCQIHITAAVAHQVIPMIGASRIKTNVIVVP